MRLLLSVGEGLGNVIQVLPLAKALKMGGIKLGILNLSNIKNSDVQFLFGVYADVVTNIEGFDGRIELGTTKGNPMHSERLQLPLANDITKQNLYRRGINEVEAYMTIAHDLGLEVNNNCFDISFAIGTEHYCDFDFIVHNGCSLVNPTQWQRKKYPKMNELIMRIESKGFSVGVIGADHEYEGQGTKLTNFNLESSAALIRRARGFISNDTGTYHLAAALKQKGVALFTATSVMKNHHPIFHKTIKPVTAGVECQDCQYTPKWNKCQPSAYNNWKCRDIPVEDVIKEIKNVCDI